MVKFVLHYFKSRGQGEIARLLLAYGGEEWEDRRYTIDEFRNTIKDCKLYSLPFSLLLPSFSHAKWTTPDP